MLIQTSVEALESILSMRLQKAGEVERTCFADVLDVRSAGAGIATKNSLQATHNSHLRDPFSLVRITLRDFACG
jgi:hypothetical protein